MSKLEALAKQFDNMNYHDFTEIISGIRVAGEAVYHLNESGMENSKDFNVDCYLVIKNYVSQLDNLLALYEGLACELHRIADSDNVNPFRTKEGVKNDTDI